MLNVYDKNQIIFSDGIRNIDFTFGADITDYEDYFVIETQISIGDIARGWIGDIKIVLAGTNWDDRYNPIENVKEDVLYQNVLCTHRIFDMHHPEVATWKYTFNKY